MARPLEPTVKQEDYVFGLGHGEHRYTVEPILILRPKRAGITGDLGAARVGSSEFVVCSQELAIVRQKQTDRDKNGHRRLARLRPHVPTAEVEERCLISRTPATVKGALGAADADMDGDDQMPPCIGLSGPSI
jgi:hypothetical protein